jgi:hypothetical protein
MIPKKYKTIMERAGIFCPFCRKTRYLYHNKITLNYHCFSGLCGNRIMIISDGVSDE